MSVYLFVCLFLFVSLFVFLFVVPRCLSFLILHNRPDQRTLLHGGRACLSVTRRVAVGTPSYMAPELMASSKLQLSQAGILEFINADVWSFGMLLQSLMNPGFEPFLVEATI